MIRPTLRGLIIRAATVLDDQTIIDRSWFYQFRGGWAVGFNDTRQTIGGREIPFALAPGLPKRFRLLPGTLVVFRKGIPLFGWDKTIGLIGKPGEVNKEMILGFIREVESTLEKKLKCPVTWTG